MCRCLEEAALPRYSKLSNILQAVSVIWAPRPSHDFRLGLLAVSKIFVRIFLKSLVFPHFPCSNPQPRWLPTLAKSSPLECFASPGLTLPNSVSTSEKSGLSGWICVSGHVIKTSWNSEVIPHSTSGHFKVVPSLSKLPKHAPWDPYLLSMSFSCPISSVFFFESSMNESSRLQVHDPGINREWTHWKETLTRGLNMEDLWKSRRCSLL